jgi:hypothetical protein
MSLSSVKNEEEREIGVPHRVEVFLQYSIIDEAEIPSSAHDAIMKEGRVILLGDHTCIPEDGRRMPCGNPASASCSVYGNIEEISITAWNLLWKPTGG